MNIRIAVALALAGAAGPCLAESQDKPVSLDSLFVVGQDINPDSVARPLVVIDENELFRRRATTIGELLRGLPGVSASGFGSNASRPIIRGQDGERVKILQNSSPVNDASAMSFDHAVGANPFALEQVEILRGPAALLYGGNAVGGVVNLVDRRILRERIDSPRRAVDLRFDSANDGKQAAAEAEAAMAKDLFVHLDAFAHRNGDTRTPVFTDNDEDPVTGKRVRNTAARSHGMGVGFSHFGPGGHWGLSADRYHSTYGVPRETGTTIRLDRDRIGLAAESVQMHPAVERVRVRGGVSDYQHQEIEDGEVASTFLNRSHDARVEVALKPRAGWRGLYGAQWEYSDFRVDGNGEAPMQPRTRSPKLGAFGLEERAVGAGTLRVGARLDRAEVRSDNTFSVSTYGNENEEGSVATDGPGKRRSFQPISASLEWSMPGGTLSLSHVQRAPSATELFSAGIHHASGLFEQGNPALGKERGNHLDLTLSRSAGVAQLRASAFLSRYDNYVTLIRRSGPDSIFHHEHAPGEMEEIPVYDYAGIPARLYGGELELRTRIKIGKWEATPALIYDVVLGKRSDTGSRLPRLTPQRLTPSLDLRSGPWRIRPELSLVARARLGENESVPAAGHGLLSLLVEYRQGRVTWFATGTNLTDRLAYNATTVDEVRAFAPIAGRAIKIGARLPL